MSFRIVRLEERIVLDAAGAAVLATVSETDAHQAETTKNRDHADTPSTDDASNHDNAPVDALDHTTIDHAVDAPQNAADEAPPSGYTSVLMVADTTENADQLVSATDDHTLIIHYSLSDTSSEALLESIHQALGDNKADSIAFAGGTLGEAGMGIARDTTLSVATLAVSQSQQDFWHAIGSLLHDGGHIDLFCDGIAGDTVSPLLTNQLQSISGQTVDINHSFENGDTFASSSPADETHAIPISQESIDATHFSDQVTAALSEHLEQQTAHDGLNIVLLDTTLPDYTQLAAAAEKDAVVLLYDGQTESADAVLDRVIAYAHDQDSPIDSLSILAHGKTGEFKLGNEWIDAADLSGHADTWSALNAVMNDDGNIYLFGCSVAQNTAADQALLDGLAQATHTDVFASDDVTGKGGDWVLEAASQGAQAELNAGPDTNLDTTALSNYADTLAPPVIVSAQTVDNDGDGYIDHIRIITDSNLDDDFSGFSATVAGYTLDATTPYLTNIGGGGANDTTFYIKVNEGGTPDTNATPLVTITGNTTLSNLGGENIASTSSTNTGWHVPTAEGEDYNNWSNGQNAYSDNGVYATENSWPGQANDWYNFNLGVPAGATIAGIEVTVDGSIQASPIGSVNIALSWNGGTSYTSNQALGLSYLTDAWSTVGGSTSTWGRTWTDTELSNTNFRLRLTFSQAFYGASTQVDAMQVRVYYASSTTVTADDANDAPVISDSTFAVNENAANGTAVGTASASDADVGDTLSYSITAGNSAGVFAINSSTGQITIANNANLDRETYSSFALTVQASDGTATDTATITVNVNDLNDITPVANDATVALTENSPNGTSVHTVVATDADVTPATLSYSITAGNSAGIFAINSSTGEITVANNANLNRETYASFALTVQVSDGTHTDTAAITVNVSDVNEFTPVANDATVALAENSANGTSVHSVVATDADATASLTYSITGGNGAGVFAINSGTGAITVANNTNLNRETYASFALTVQVSDGTNTDTATITVNVSDVNEFTPVANDATVALAENSANGTSVHTVVATDADATATLTYSITGGNGAGVFAINSGTGAITVANNTNLNRETYASFALTVQVSDGTHTDTATITVNVSDVNEFTPVANDATVALSEDAVNGTSVHTVVATDADATASLTYLITAGNEDGVFTININSGEITVADDTTLDALTTPSYALTVQVTDGSNIDTATITVDITGVSQYAPVADNATVTLAENTVNGTSVHTVVASDADFEPLAYTITAGNAAGVFAIDSSTGEITVADNTNLDRETTASFALTVQVSDGTFADTATITINITDVNDSVPVANNATVTLAENTANGASVHDVVATDADPTASLTYSIIGGNGAGVFAIDSSTGEITVTDNTNLNRETTASFALTVQVSDGTNTDTATITVNVADVNEFAPVANNATVALTENAVNGTSVHTVVASDTDATASLTYSITGGNDAGVFTINASTGEITVVDNTHLSREEHASFTLSVQVSDGTHADTATVTVNISDVNEFTPVANDATVALTENSANGTSVHTVVATDADPAATLTYAITGGNGAGVFAIDANTGEITVADNANLNRESYASFVLTVQVSDGTNTDTATVTVNVSDVNEFTPVANDATVALTENSPNATSVHTVVATDADSTATLTYAITGGNGAAVFTIDANTGEITVADNANLNRESYASFALTVQVSDGTHTDTATITVNVTDINEFTPVANDATVALAENTANGTSVHTVVATDADPAATLTYAITGGNGAGVFAINSSTGEITVANNTNLDRETTASFALTVQVSDGTNTDAATITVNVSDVNEFTPVANDATVALAENSANGTSVHTVVATDADPGATLAYSITGGNGAGVFAINSSTGEITVANNTNLDREAYASFALTVQVSDGTNTDTATVTVNVTDVNEFTPVANDATVALAENSANGTSVHTVVATDADPGATLAYSITGGNGAGVFAINSSTGEITVANNTNLDREAYASFALTVQVSDGTNTDTATVTVNVTDVNEFTPVANDATVALAENTANGTSVHTVVATDADPGATLSYSITGGNGAGVFAINSSTGEITVADNANLDREITASFTLTVQVSDGTNTDAATITVNVTDVNEFTPVANDATVALTENSVNGTSVHTVVATDADPGATLSYSITGGNGAGVFAINPSTGEITVANNTNLDREAYASFALTVQVSDGTNTDAATITVNVTDVNDTAPVAIDATVALTENSPNGTSVHSVVATDADPLTTLTYAITGGNGAGVFAIDSGTGEITVADNTNLDREAYAAFILTVQVSDGTHGDTATITVNVTDLNDNVPTIGDNLFSVRDDAANATVVGTVAAGDSDPSATHTYAIIGGNDGGVFTIDADTGTITVADHTALDGATTPSYTLTIQVSDGAFTATATITIDVANVNETIPAPPPPAQEPGEETEPDQPEDKIDAPIELLPEVNGPESTTLPTAMEVIDEAFTEQGGDPAMQNPDTSLYQTRGIFPYSFFARPNSEEINASFTTFPGGPKPALKNNMESSDAEENLLLNTRRAEMWSGTDSIEKQSDSIFVGIFTGLTTLVAGYVGWVNGLLSMLFGFFSSAPLWKSFDPVPIFDAERDKTLIDQGWVSDKEEPLDEKVDSLFDPEKQP